MSQSQAAPQFSDEFLLQCISNYRPLYDKSDKGYKSLIQRENCWASVARSLNCTAAEAKVRFKSLREKYRREVQIEEKLQRSGAPASVRPVWPLTSFFKYMNRCGLEQHRPTTSNVSNENHSQNDPEVDVGDVNFSDEENVVSYVDEEDSRSELNEATATPLSSHSNVPERQAAKKKRKSLTDFTNLDEEKKQIDKVLLDVSSAIKNLNPVKSQKEDSSNRYEMFSQFLAAELKSVKEPHASILMEELQVVIINYKRDLRSNESND